jgi:ABC-2 family transporter protein
MMARDGFGQLLRAEWTKLRSVRRWTLAMLSAVLITVVFGLISVAASGDTDANEVPGLVVGPDGQTVADNFFFVHQPLPGDGSITARVVSQAPSHEWAGAGVMLKLSATAGAPYAAVMVTPSHGVRLQANFSTDRPGGAGAGPHWLRLTRSGEDITGYESADGVTWRTIGTVRLRGLLETVEVGLFVSSPPKVIVVRQSGTTSATERATNGEATFDRVSLHTERALPPQTWQGDDINGGVSFKVSGSSGVTRAGDTFRITGSGRIGPNPADDDVVQMSLIGVQIGLMAIVAVGVLFVTSEYRRGMIRTTLAASRGRGRVLAAKGLVLGLAAFVVGLVGTVAAFALTQPLLRSRGFRPPVFPYVSLFDAPVLRAVLTTSAFLAVIAVFSLAVGTILRHSAGAITTVIVLVILPIFASTSLPIGPAKWLMLLTPTGGFATQRAKPPTNVLAEPWSMISAWAGLGVVCAYAMVALAVAYWLLRRRDA